MENEHESALDAINEALGLGDEPAESDADVGEEAAVVAEGEAEILEEGEAAVEGAAGEDGKPAADTGRNADGTFKKAVDGKPAAGAKPADGKPAAGKEGDAAAAAAAAAGKKAPDPINDPIPEGLKQETQDRMRSLIKTAKEVTTERDKFKTDFDYMIQGVQATGTTPEQYGEVLSFMALFNSNDPVQQGKALELVENVADRLATLLGKERSVGDPLQGHEDLQLAVKNGQVTAKYAQEIARTRNSSTFRGQLTETARTDQQRQDAAAQEMHQARTDLKAFEDDKSKSDPQYAAKKAILVPVLKPIMASLPPSHWKATFEQAYNKIRVGAAPARPRVPGNQPLRAGKNPSGAGGSGAGGMTPQAGSALDAVNNALATMGR